MVRNMIQAIIVYFKGICKTCQGSGYDENGNLCPKCRGSGEEKDLDECRSLLI